MMRHWFGLLFSVFYFCVPVLADQSYDRRLVEHLNEFKQYPASANARHASGETLVTFSVDREGRIVSSSVVRSSGDDELDRASLEMLIRAQPLPLPAEMTSSPERFTLPVIFRSKAAMESSSPDIDLSAFMAGKCRSLKIVGRDFTCKSVSYFHTKQGRANFTVVLDDPTDDGHVISFSGENGRKINDDLYELPIDRMLLNSKDRPKISGLPVPSVEPSAGICKQLGSFSARQVSSITCTAMDRNGKRYELAFESDGSPITVKGQKDERVSEPPPTIAQTAPPQNSTSLPTEARTATPDNQNLDGANPSAGSYVGRWYVDDPAVCKSPIDDLAEGLLVYSPKEFRGTESSCQIMKSVLRGTKTDLTMRCSGEGMTSAEPDHETLEVVGDKLKRTFREGRRQRTFTYNRCPSATILAGGKLYYGSRAGMTVTVVSKSGINSDRAVIKTEHTKEDATGYCRDYVGKVTAKCIQDAMAIRIRDEITGNCRTGRFTSFFGEDHQYLGAMKSKNDETFAKYAIKTLATGQIADGSSASGYPTNMGIFRALCPLKAPPDE
jgi:TonB family protein